MGNSGRIAIGAVFGAAVLLVLTAITLEEAALFAFLGTVALGYLACVVQVAARGRTLALLAGGVGTSLFLGFSIAFLRMWGLAFNQDAAALGTAISTQDSDIYFYLAAASGSATLLVLFAGAVWPHGKSVRAARKPAVPSRRRPSAQSKRPASASGRAVPKTAARPPVRRAPSPTVSKVPVKASAKVPAKGAAKGRVRASARR